jgi:hypothetical protein
MEVSTVNTNQDREQDFVEIRYRLWRKSQNKKGNPDNLPPKIVCCVAKPKLICCAFRSLAFSIINLKILSTIRFELKMML